MFRKYIFNGSVRLGTEKTCRAVTMTVPCPEYYKGWLLLGQTRRIDLCLALAPATHSCPPPLHTSLISAASYLPISLQLNTAACILAGRGPGSRLTTPTAGARLYLVSSQGSLVISSDVILGQLS